MKIKTMTSTEGKMKLLEFDVSLSKFSYIIESDCSNILKIFRSCNKVLFRGIKSEKSIINGQSPINRKPMDTTLDLQELIDSKLRAAGFKALRSNSIFCASDYFSTEYYGNPYIIFPINGFDFSFCRYADLHEELKLSKQELENLSPEEFVSTLKYNNTNIKIALKKSMEICIHGNYIAVSYDEYKNQLDNFLDFDIKKNMPKVF